MKSTQKLLLVLLFTSALARQSCGQGSALTASGICEHTVYIEGCWVYASATECSICEHNYVKNGAVCSYQPDQSKDCCKVYGANRVCTQCADGLIRNADGGCSENKIIGCIQKRDGICISCCKDFKLEDGKCVKVIEGCLSYHADGCCSLCVSTYRLDQGVCTNDTPDVIIQEQCVKPYEKSGNGNCVIPGCARLFEYGCLSCGEGYSLTRDGGCTEDNIPGCLKYSDSGVCAYCLSPSYTLSEGFCVPAGCLTVRKDGSCQQCNSNKGFLNDDGTCVIPNCRYATSEGCQLCEGNRVPTPEGCLESSYEVVCINCAFSQYLGVDGKCHDREPGCQKYESGFCATCFEGYVLTIVGGRKVCVKVVPGCIYRNGICAECAAPFQRQGDSCVIVGCVEYYSGEVQGCKVCRHPFSRTSQYTCEIPNCLQVFGEKCRTCAEGYTEVDGYCEKIDTNCERTNIERRCTKCKEGYELVKGWCEKRIYGCNYVDDRCVSCRAPFTYDQSKESCYIDGCTEYFVGGCKVCSSVYLLRYNDCKLPHCLTSKNGACLECDPDYILRANGACVNKDEYCETFNDQGVCIKCFPAYFMSVKQDKCLKREPGCIYNAEDECASCYAPFLPVTGGCEINGCLKHNLEGCHNCRYPYILDKRTNLCIVPDCAKMDGSICKRCNQGYILNEEGLCAKKDSKCIKYEGKDCVKCIKGYAVDSYGNCQYVDEHCWDFTREGHCTNCDRLYFLNKFRKCQLKDSNCEAYTGGECSKCKPFFFSHQGVCFPKTKGCLIQKNIRECVRCEEGYQLSRGICKEKIKKLTWNSIDMDFFGDEVFEDEKEEDLAQIFTEGKETKLNLDPAISIKYGVVIYSTTTTNVNFAIDSQGSGWQVTSASPVGQYIGVRVPRLETFYAIDVKVLAGNQMTLFDIEYSEDGIEFRKIRSVSLERVVIGSVETIYFKAVHATIVRLVVKRGAPNIKVEFYYNNLKNEYKTSTVNNNIGETIIETVEAAGNGNALNTACKDKGLCWMGIEVCKPTEITGFEMIPTKESTGSVDLFYVDYSIDGVHFDCLQACKPIALNGWTHTFPDAVTASKLRVHVSKYSGNPKFAIKFNY